MKKLSLSLIAIVCTWTFILIACSAPKSPINVNGDGIAIKGYDPVAYFTLSRPVKGLKEYQFEWNNAKWFFCKQRAPDNVSDESRQVRSAIRGLLSLCRKPWVHG